MKIFKFRLQVTDTQSIMVPGGAEIVSVQFHDDALFAWAKVDPDAPEVSKTIRIAGTGHELGDDDMKYHATVLDPDRFHVWHVFEIL